MFGKLGLGLGLGGGGGARLHPATVAYIAGIVAAGGSAPDAARTAIIDTLVKSLIFNGIWDKLSALYVAGHDITSSLVNIVNPSIVATRVNNLADNKYTNDMGWVGDTGKALDLRINLSTDTKYNGGLGLLGVFVSQEITDQYVIPIGSRETVNTNNNHITKASDLMRAIQYVNGAQTGVSTPSLALGFFTTTTTAAKQVQLSKDGKIIDEYNGTSNISTGNIYNANCYGLAVNTGGSPTFPVLSGVISAFVIGGNMSAHATNPSDVSRLYDALNTYLIAIGAKAA